MAIMSPEDPGPSKSNRFQPKGGANSIRPAMADAMADKNQRKTPVLKSGEDR